jgi:hypothetical protein
MAYQELNQAIENVVATALRVNQVAHPDPTQVANAVRACQRTRNALQNILNSPVQDHPLEEVPAPQVATPTRASVRPRDVRRPVPGVSTLGRDVVGSEIPPLDATEYLNDNEYNEVAQDVREQRQMLRESVRSVHQFVNKLISWREARWSRPRDAGIWLVRTFQDACNNKYISQQEMSAAWAYMAPSWHDRRSQESLETATQWLVDEDLIHQATRSKLG